ncbi:MAG: endonuclease V [Thermofilaceae archaeon]|nr:endonuclease V [Thermofilaceae archaeon]
MGFNVRKARYAQTVIAKKVSEEDELPRELRYACGVDVAYASDLAVAVATAVNYDNLNIVSKAAVILKVSVPYIPTLLAFREAGPMIAAVRSLNVKPDVVLVDGNGRLHPLGAGIACQVGLALCTTTIGVAKKLLCGEVGEWTENQAPVLIAGRVVGMAIRLDAKPIYVSVGHKISLPTAVKIVRELTPKGRGIPEPLRISHLEASRIARRLKNELFL